MTRAFLLCLVLLLAFPGPAHATLAPADLDTVAMAVQPGTALPRDIRFVDQHGTARRLGDILGRRPAVLVLADYDCAEICGPILAVVGGALAGTGLKTGVDYDFLAVGLNPRATPADATRMGTAQLDPAVAEKAELLSGTPEAVAAIEEALAYRAIYDPDSGRYAHPADILVLTADARVSRVLPGLAVDADRLRAALVAAGQGRIGTWSERLRLLCYGLDPAHGVANRAVVTGLAAGGVLTLVGLGVFVVTLALRSSTRSYPAPSYRGGGAEPGTGALQPRWSRLPGSGSPLRFVRNERAVSRNEAPVMAPRSLPPGSPT